MYGWMDGWMKNDGFGVPRRLQKSSKIMVLGVWRALGGVVLGVWRALGGGLGAKWAPEPKKCPKRWFADPPGDPKMGPQIHQKSAKSGQERHKSAIKRHKMAQERPNSGQKLLKSRQERPKMPGDASKRPLERFSGRFWVAKWSQVGTQIGAKRDVNYKKLERLEYCKNQ